MTDRFLICMYLLAFAAVVVVAAAVIIGLLV